MLVLENVSKRYGKVLALSSVSLEIAAGQTTVLIGPSGCGKSTLLRLMLGLGHSDTGRVRIGGVTVTADNAEQLRRRIGYVIQDGGLFPHLTAQQNIALLARYLGWERERIAARIAELLSLTQLPAEVLGRYPGELSGGQRQRVALMRALMLDPELLLLDEPMGALDPMIRCDLQADLRRIFVALRKTVVLVTHDLGEAAFLGDTLVLLRDGAIVQVGSLAELYHQPADPFVRRFINAQRSPLDQLAAAS
jgi:osmoprotectant transport system ATP-binding protein